MFVRRHRAGINVWQVDSWTDLGVLHGFSDRFGGVSRGPYASLNVGLHVGDEPADVIENRRRLCRALGVDPESLVVGEQVHGIQVAVVTAADKGRGAFSLTDVVPGVDALITDTPGVALFAMYADCVPVFLYDPRRRAVGLAHAGWKGTVAGIARRTVQAMHETFGSRPADMYARPIGPSIGPCCYEVGPEVAGQFASRRSPRSSGRNGHRQRVNLWAANEQQLTETEIAAGEHRIARVVHSVPCRDVFFPSRAKRADGPHGSRHRLVNDCSAGRTWYSLTRTVTGGEVRARGARPQIAAILLTVLGLFGFLSLFFDATGQIGALLADWLRRVAVGSALARP